MMSHRIHKVRSLVLRWCVRLFSSLQEENSLLTESSFIRVVYETFFQKVHLELPVQSTNQMNSHRQTILKLFTGSVRSECSSCMVFSQKVGSKCDRSNIGVSCRILSQSCFPYFVVVFSVKQKVGNVVNIVLLHSEG